jgi:hypothetical protein
MPRGTPLTFREQRQHAPDHFSVVARLVFGALSVLLGNWGPAIAQEEAGKPNTLCWSPEALQSNPREALIHKRVSEAFVIPPDRKLITFIPEPKASRLSVRGVVLPVNAPKLLALTFDLCELPDEITGYDGMIVDFLRANKIKATFFAGGKWLLTHRSRAEQLIADPLFEIGNHTWEHRNLRILDDAGSLAEINNAQSAYEELRHDLSGRQCLG